MVFVLFLSQLAVRNYEEAVLSACDNLATLMGTCGWLAGHGEGSRGGGRLGAPTGIRGEGGKVEGDDKG